MFIRSKILIIRLVVFGFLISIINATPTQRRNLFEQLYNQLSNANYSLGTPPGTQFSAPTVLNHSLKPYDSGLNLIMGSFASEPGQGGRVILKSVPFQGDGIEQLFSRQFFSGYRWFWHELDGRIVSPVQGGFYDLSASTLPTNASYSYNNHLFQFNWTGPTATGYGTKLIFKESIRSEKMENASGTIVFEGDATSATFLHTPRPGYLMHFAFFGSYPVGAVRIDSGSGNQYWPNQSGVYEVIGGVHQSFELSKLRMLLVIAVPLIDRFSKNIFKLRPTFAPDPTDPEGNIIPWPVTDSHLTIYGKNWTADKHFVRENGVLLDESRILDWGSEHIHVSLPGSLLTTTQPCLDMIYTVESKTDNGLISNAGSTRLVNANHNYAILCEH